MTKMILVRLDNSRYGAGPATVIARIDSLNDVPRDKDGARDERLRVWVGDAAVGDRVMMRNG